MRSTPVELLLTAALDYAARGFCVLPVAGKRPACRSWKQYQQQRPDEETIRRWFSNARITGVAVVLGNISGGLTCRDFDLSTSYEIWKKRYGQYASQLPTVRTGRGFHVYFRSEFNSIRKLGDGELRGAGICVLPPSAHPSGRNYCWLAPLSTASISEVDPRKAGLVACYTEGAEDTVSTVGAREHKTTQTTDAIERAIFSTLPARAGERNRAIFQFCRELKSIASLADADPRQLRHVVERWHLLAKPIIATKPFEESWIDFLKAWPKVKFPAGCGPLASILAKAKARTHPAGYPQYEQQELPPARGDLRRAAGRGRRRRVFLELPHGRPASRC